MGVKTFFDRRIKPFMDVPKWMGLAYLKQNAQKIIALGKTYFVPAKAERVEDFDAALARLNMSPQQLLKVQKKMRLMLMLAIMMDILIFAYVVHLLLKGHFLGSFTSCFILSLSLGITFRYHFWLFQIKKRKLGCTLREWFYEGLLGEKAR